MGVLYSVTLLLDTLRCSAAAPAAPVHLLIPEARANACMSGMFECLLPPERIDGYLASLRALAEERRLLLHGVSVRRFHPGKTPFLRCPEREWAAVRVSFGVKPTLGASVLAAQIRRLLLGLALERGGSFALRNPRDATCEQLNACYPMLPSFLAEKRRYDPAERLQNDWYRCLLAKQRAGNCEVRWGS
jgi:hypothetical protein